MSADQSYLSVKEYQHSYGYDFVVATTQASINTGLKEYLSTAPEPEIILCYVNDTDGNPTVLITLPELLARTNNLNPFNIPNDTPYNDPRMQVMTQAGFRVGLRIRMGLPPGIMPNALPPVVVLGASADKVQFNTLCSEIHIAQNIPNTSAWGAWSQPLGQAWYFSSTVDLVNANLDTELNTAYFNSHPDEKAALLAQLQNLGSTAFSLQQLLFDLDSAALQPTPPLAGLDPDSPAASVLKQLFIGAYFDQMKQNGSPVLSVHVVSPTPDNSSLQLTSMEREIGQLVDGEGNVLPSLTPEQAQATTLTFLCAANNNPLPPATPFTWNWVEPADVENMSGVIAINRNTLATYYKNKLLPLVSSSCIQSQMRVDYDSRSGANYSFRLTPGGIPQSVVITDPELGAPSVLIISYECVAGAHTSDSLGFMVEFDMHTYYTCTVSFSGSTITIVQNLKVYLFFRNGPSTGSGNVVDTTITDTYVLSIGQDGNIITTATSATQHNGCDPRTLYPGIAPTNNPYIAEQVAGYAYQMESIGLKPIPAQNIQSFVFPGGKVFTYKDIRFSDHQDLVSSVTYVAPSPASATPHRTGVPVL